jgi:LCP family protein required for cell wall assembly
LSGYRNIAILGSDARADEGYEGSRTDAIIIMSIKKSTGQVRLISVMRDSYLQMEYFDGTTVLDKITHAYHYLGGVNTCASLNQSLDLNIDEYVVFNWKAVADAVDCLGGIEVNVQESEISDMNHWGPDTAENVGGDYTEITQSGTQTLDGVQATTYCRIRKTSGGDEGRGQRYKKVMAAVMKKAMTQPWKLAELSSTVFPNIQTNMSQTELFTAVLGAPRYEIETSISWPENYYSGLLWDVSYVVPLTLESEVAALHEKAFDQEDYTVSDTCRQISQNIIYDTGLE